MHIIETKKSKILAAAAAATAPVMCAAYVKEPDTGLW